MDQGVRMDRTNQGQGAAADRERGSKLRVFQRRLAQTNRSLRQVVVSYRVGFPENVQTPAFRRQPRISTQCGPSVSNSRTFAV